MKNLIYKWFYSYTASFLKNDDPAPYALKYDHTLKVAKNCHAIAQQSNFNEKDTDIAEIIGLLHDCGRFQQFAQYGTFNDKVSENHAELSAYIIKNQGLLDNIKSEEQEIILKAVTNHNKKELVEADFTDKALIFAKIIRDADKIDIYRVMAEQIKNPKIDHKALFLNQSEEIAYSSPILESIRNRSIANLDDMRTEVDFRMLQLSWVFDINFSASLKLIKSQGNLHYLMDILPEKKTVQEELNIIKKHINYENQ